MRRLNDTELSLKLFVVLSRAFESIEKELRDRIRDYGMNLTEFAVLELLYHKGDQPTQKIGEKILIPPSNTTNVLNKLERGNYIKQVTGPTGRRVNYTTITDEGKQLMNKLFPEHQKLMTDLMCGLEIREKEIMIDLLKRLGLTAQAYKAQ